MKKILFVTLFYFLFSNVYAGHIAGGEIYYTLLSSNNGTNQYRISVRLFRECNPPAGSQPIAQLPTSVQIGIFNNTSNPTAFNTNIVAQLDGPISSLQLMQPNPCITNAPTVCYQVANYSINVDLPQTSAGYIIAFETCCRTNGIQNIGPFSGTGATYTAEIPGTNVIAQMQNKSAVFNLKDTALICKFSNFTLDFSASDPDNDSLVYSFCDAYTAKTAVNSNPIPPSSPSYTSIPYASGYGGTIPLGSSVTIDKKTGIISGTSPGPGAYVLNVCVAEYRNGQLITVHRKDFTLKIGDCQLTAAQLKPTYIVCDSSIVHFQNESTSSDVVSYKWDFGVPNTTTDVSTSPTPVYNYKDTGTYTIKLVVTNSASCEDSATAQVLVYPGFIPDFNVTGSCLLNDYKFTDQTFAQYGTVNSWGWNFGDLSTDADSSHLKNPLYKYNSSGIVNVQLIVSSSKGCIDTIMKALDVKDKPTLNLPFKDTLICSIDTLKLVANNSGTVQWTPNYNIINSNTSTPLVFPKDTTVYRVTVNENGCINTDSITVNVLDFISVDAGPNINICRTDSIRIPTVSYALNYVWTPSVGLNSNAVKQPMAAPLVNTTYYVTANLGKCQDRDSVKIFVTPYPQAVAGPDTTICFNSFATLHASIVGSSFTWTPLTGMTNSKSLTPTVRPISSTAYVISAYDTLGCPKPYRDTIIINVTPQILAFAGNDTSVIAGQPLQLNATGGSSYAWSPTIGMTTSNIPNPVITLSSSVDSIVYTVTVSEGLCSAQDNVKVKVYKTGPEIFVPTAFTPNSDGRNDLVRPVIVGMRNLQFFSIYNRWGQRVYTTTDLEQGWNGNFNGVPQPAGTYVYIAQAIDYTGKTVFRKGTVVLIR